MSLEALAAYLSTVDGDDRKDAALTHALSGTTGEAAREAVAALARDEGFDVAADDMSEAFRMVSQATQPDGELPDDALEGVAAGVSIEQFNALHRITPEQWLIMQKRG